LGLISKKRIGRRLGELERITRVENKGTGSVLTCCISMEIIVS